MDIYQFFYNPNGKFALSAKCMENVQETDNMLGDQKLKEPKYLPAYT